jgi:hypothetical protein
MLGFDDVASDGSEVGRVLSISSQVPHDTGHTSLMVSLEHNALPLDVVKYEHGAVKSVPSMVNEMFSSESVHSSSLSVVGKLG